VEGKEIWGEKREKRCKSGLGKRSFIVTDDSVSHVYLFVGCAAMRANPRTVLRKSKWRALESYPALISCDPCDNRLSSVKCMAWRTW
jgi:hypothetical protein